MISKKVILTGSFGVGKTSLFNQFVYSKFSDKYMTTLGVKVNKKVFMVDDQEMSFLLWDIAGEVTQDKVPDAYFLGASAIIYVFDLTRSLTLSHAQSDLAHLRKIHPDGLIFVVGNKSDLLDIQQVQKTVEDAPVKVHITTSAKTGENVNELFVQIGKHLLDELSDKNEN